MRKLMAVLWCLIAWPVFAVSTEAWVPAEFNGSAAVVRDSITAREKERHLFFVVTHINGKEVANTLSKSARRGETVPVPAQRFVGVVPVTVRILGRTGVPAPFFALFEDVYELAGEVRFTPEKNRSYSVRGEFGPHYSAVWIEDDLTRKVVGQKVVMNGSAKTGVFGR